MKVLNSLNIGEIEELSNMVTLKQRSVQDNTNIIQNLKSFFDTSRVEEIFQQNDRPTNVCMDDGDDIISVDVTVNNSTDDAEESNESDIEDFHDEDFIKDNVIVQKCLAEAITGTK